MSTFRKPGSQYFWFDFTFKGRRIQKSTKVTNKREADNIEKAAWTQLARGEVSIEERPTAERKTVGQLLDALENNFKARKKDSVKNLNLIAVVRRELGDRWADAFNTEELTKYISSLRRPRKSKDKGRRTNGPLSDSTIRHRLLILHQAFEIENKERAKNKVQNTLAVPEFPEISEAGNERSGFLSRAQFDVLLSHLPNDGLRDFCLFAYLVGWRKSAIANLEWSDVRDGNVYLRGKLSKNRKPYFVPVVGNEMIQLIERRKEARAVRTASGATISPFVFHRGGERIAEFRKSWTTACKKAELAGTLFHDLRRSAARNLVRSGVTTGVAKTLGGWATDSIFNRYNISSEGDLRAAMEKVTNYNQMESQKVASIGG